MKIFISYASEDLAHAKRLYAQLSVMGMTPWMDKYNLLPGQDWKNEISSQIYKSDVLVVLLSETMISKRGFVQNELKAALDTAKEIPEGRIFIIPARVDVCKIPDSLSKYHCIDLFERAGIVKLVDAIDQNKMKISPASSDAGHYIHSELVLDVLRAVLNDAVNWNALSITDFIQNFFPVARLMLLSKLMETGDETNSDIVKTTLTITDPTKFLSMFQKFFVLKKYLRTEQERLLNKAIANIRAGIAKKRASDSGSRFNRNRFVASVVRNFYKENYPLTTQNLMDIYHTKEFLGINPDSYCNDEVNIHLKHNLANLVPGDILQVLVDDGSRKRTIKVTKKSKSVSIKGNAFCFSLSNQPDQTKSVGLQNILAVSHLRNNTPISFIDFQREHHCAQQ